MTSGNFYGSRQNFSLETFVSLPPSRSGRQALELTRTALVLASLTRRRHHRKGRPRCLGTGWEALAGSRTGSQLIALSLESLASQDGRLRPSGAVFWQKPHLFKMKQTKQLTNYHQQKQQARAAGSAGCAQPRSPETDLAYWRGSIQQQGSPHPVSAPLGGISAAPGHPDSFYFKGHTRCEVF